MTESWIKRFVRCFDVILLEWPMERLSIWVVRVDVRVLGVVVVCVLSVFRLWFLWNFA